MRWASSIGGCCRVLRMSSRREGQRLTYGYNLGSRSGGWGLFFIFYYFSELSLFSSSPWQELASCRLFSFFSVVFDVGHFRLFLRELVALSGLFVGPAVYLFILIRVKGERGYSWGFWEVK